MFASHPAHQMEEKRTMSKSTKVVLAIVGIIVLALGGGLLGAKIGGGSSDSASSSSSSFIDGIVARGELRVGVAEAPPLTGVQPDGTLGGANVIPLQNLAKELGVKFTPVAAEWKDIVAGLQAGRYDFAANLDATTKRSLSIMFTNPVYQYQGVFVVPADAPYSTAADLLSSGVEIGTAQGSAPEAALIALGAKVQSTDTYQNAVSAMTAGRSGAVFTDSPTAVGMAQADSNLKIIVPDPLIYSADVSYGVPADIDLHSLTIVNIAIARAIGSGEMAAAYAAVDYREIADLGDLRKK